MRVRLSVVGTACGAERCWRVQKEHKRGGRERRGVRRIARGCALRKRRCEAKNELTRSEGAMALDSGGGVKTPGEGAGVGTCGRACARQGRWPRSRAVGGKKIREKRGRGAQMVCDAGAASKRVRKERRAAQE